MLMAQLPGRIDAPDPLGGAADEQQRCGSQHTDEDNADAQLAGAVHRQIQPSHHNSAQDRTQHRQRDADSS